MANGQLHQIEADVFSAFMVEDYESGLFVVNNFLCSSEACHGELFNAALAVHDDIQTLGTRPYSEN